MKYSTAKTILRVYKCEGRIEKKKKRAARNKFKHPHRDSPPDLSRTLPIPDKMDNFNQIMAANWVKIFSLRFGGCNS